MEDERRRKKKMQVVLPRQAKGGRFPESLVQRE
jgi:hypothetical protein